VTNPQPRSSAVSPLIDWSRVRSVLLVRLRSIGDTVLMTACLDALKTWRPDIRIGVVIEPRAQQIVEGHPLVDDLFLVDSSLGSRLSLLARLRRERFDVAFNLHGGTTAMFLTAFSGAKHTAGFRDQRASWMLSKRAPAPDLILGRERIHSVEQQLALLRWAGVPMPERARLSLKPEQHAAASVKAKLTRAGAANRLAIVAPGAAFESKRWNARGFAAVIDHLRNRWQLDSIIIAGPGQGSLAGEVAGRSSHNPLVLSDVSLAELTALIGSFGRVFVGNDSGPMHIAAALDCPVVAVFGSSNPDVWHPWTGAPYRVVGGERGRGDSDIRGSIDAIAVEDVMAAVDEVLQSAAAEAASR
jgi:ADP-heptose:LPS heptosyltransferase